MQTDGVGQRVPGMMAGAAGRFHPSLASGFLSFFLSFFLFTFFLSLPLVSTFGFLLSLFCPVWLLLSAVPSCLGPCPEVEFQFISIESSQGPLCCSLLRSFCGPLALTHTWELCAQSSQFPQSIYPFLAEAAKTGSAPLPLSFTAVVVLEDRASSKMGGPGPL